MSLEPNRWYWYDRKKREVIELMAEGYVPAKEQRAGLSADAVAVLTDKNGEIDGEIFYTGRPHEPARHA